MTAVKYPCLYRHACKFTVRFVIFLGSNPTPYFQQFVDSLLERYIIVYELSKHCYHASKHINATNKH